MNYKEAMKYITNTAKFGSNYGLSRTEKILEILGNPHKKIKTIHIAGTNGKGSTTAMINSILCEAGFKVGMYTSPYLEEFEERIQISNNNIPKNELAKVVTEVSKAVEEVISLGYDHPTEFEIITCAMFLYFYKENVDYAVIEVGLGGRLDSTNVICPLLSVITSISYDHMNILGNSLEEIAREKAGIIKENVPVILYPQKQEAFKEIEKKSKEMHSELILVKDEDAALLDSFEKDSKVYQNIKVKTFSNEYSIELSLLGKHQLLNCAVALNAVEKLCNIDNISIKEEVIKAALKKVIWPGRLEVMSLKPKIVIDGAHNIDGISMLKENVNQYFTYNKLILILGILADKQVEDMIKTIVPLGEKVIAVTPHSERAELAEKLKEHIVKYNTHCEVIEDYKEAFEKALEYCEEDDLLLISGSLYMIGDMRKIIKKHLNK